MSAPIMPQKSSAEAPALSTAQQQQPRKLTALERNNLEWKAHKEEIWSIYMDQDKTLKETMQWFEQERSFSWSERKWKEKMKEWDFEKNIPANDTNFMAAKARKRELEDGKETVFYRHCKLVDHGKVGSFKKQKLYENSFQELFIPATPKHISYETPKPVTFNDSVTTISEEAIELQTADQETVSAVNANLNSRKNSFLATVDGQSSESVSSTADLSNKDSIIDAPQPVFPSDSIPSFSGQKPNHSVIQITTGRVLIELSDDLSFHSRNEHIIQSWPDPMEALYKLDHIMSTTEVAREHILMAKQYFENGQRLNALKSYCTAFQKFIKQRWRIYNPDFTRFATELANAFNFCPRGEISAGGLVCVDLLESLEQAPQASPEVRIRFFAALRTLLATDPDTPKELKIHQVFETLRYSNLRALLLPALRAYFESRHQELEASERLERNHRSDLLALACVLHIDLEKGISASVRAISHAHEIVIRLRHSNCLFEAELTRLEEEMNCITASPYSRETFFSFRSSMTLPITALASACSAKGWIHQAEILFAVLRSTRGLENVMFQHQIEIAIEYCLHLERRERHIELISEVQSTIEKLESSRIPESFLGGFMASTGVHSIYENFESLYIPGSLLEGFMVSEKLPHYIRTLKDILKRVLESNIISTSTNQVSELYSKLDTFETRFSSISRTRALSPSTPIIDAAQKDRMEDRIAVEMEDGDVDEAMNDDCLSSNKFGVTYTESGITDISFNYSNLYK